MDRIWEDLLIHLRSNLSLTEYDTWIKKLKFKGIYGDDFVMITDSPQVQQHMQNNHTMVFTNGLLKVSGGRKLNPVFIFGAENELDTPNLNPRYTFDTFVVGSNNNLAFAAAKAIAEDPTKYNPFLIYGGPGLGKTHLMHAIGHRIKENNPSARILYVTSEEFTTELIRAIQNRQNESFRNRYRHVDVLLVDDIQFIAGKTSTQEEFFHTFEALYKANKQIVMTSDLHPQHMSTLEERLKSRFIAGLSYDVQLPNLETRVAILKSKLEADHVQMDDDAVFFIANIRDGNVRELEGYLTRVLSYSQLTGEPITTKLCEIALHDIIPKEVSREITIESISEAVCMYYGVRMEDLVSNRRSQNIAFARMVAMYLCHTYTDKSLKQIGHYYGGRDHTTVMHGRDRISTMAKEDPSMRSAIEDIIKSIRRSAN